MTHRTILTQHVASTPEPYAQHFHSVDEIDVFAFCQTNPLIAPVPIRDLIGPFIVYGLVRHLMERAQPTDLATVKALEDDPVECAIIFARAAERLCGETYPFGTAQTLYKAYLAVSEMYKCRAGSDAGRKPIEDSDIHHHRRCAWTYAHTLARADPDPDFEIAAVQATLKGMMTDRKAAKRRSTGRRKALPKPRAKAPARSSGVMEKEWRKIMRDAGVPAY